MSPKRKHSFGQNQKEVQARKNLRRIRAVIADVLRDDSVPEELLEQPEVIDEPATQQDETIDFVEVYGRTQDEDWEGDGPEVAAPKLRPSLEFFVADGELRFVVKSDIARIDSSNREAVTNRLKKLRLLGNVLLERYSGYLRGDVPELVTVLNQKELVKTYAAGVLSASVLSNLLKFRSVELPDGQIMPLRRFFPKKRGDKGVIDENLRVEFAREYLGGHKDAQGQELMTAYVAKKLYLKEASKPDGNGKNYQNSLARWFNNHLLKIKAMH